MPRPPQARLWVVLLIVLAICGLLTVVHKRAENRGDDDGVSSSIRRYLLAAPARGIEMARSWGATNVGSLFSGPKLARQNFSLRAQIAQLELQNRDLQEEGSENARLRRLLTFKARSQMSLLPAQVIALKPSPLRDTLTLARGFHDGVSRKMVVLDPAGALVGQVIDVTSDTCDVLLLTDDLSSAGAIVVPSGRPASKTGVVGICQGESAPQLKLIDIPQNSDVRPGDTLITSGLGGIYPRGIPIGTVRNVAQDKSSYQKEAEIAPAANFDHLREAFLLLSQ